MCKMGVLCVKVDTLIWNMLSRKLTIRTHIPYLVVESFIVHPHSLQCAKTVSVLAISRVEVIGTPPPVQVFLDKKVEML